MEIQSQIEDHSILILPISQDFITRHNETRCV